MLFRSNNPDNERAFLISHFKSDETLKIRFSKNLYPEKYLLQKIEAVDVLLSEFSFINYPYTDYIELTYNGIAQDDDLQPFVLKVDSLKCLSFNPVFSPGELEFEYPDSPKTGDIKFSFMYSSHQLIPKKKFWSKLRVL